jgi:hypothetical protein
MAFRPWEYRTETGSVGYEVDLTGYSVAAVDGDIGHVDEAINELLGGSYLLVDTGPVFGRTVMRPAGWSNGSAPPRKRSTSTEPRTRSRTRRVRRALRRRPVSGLARRLLRRAVPHSRHPDVTRGAGPLTPVGQHLGESGILDWLTPGVPLLAAPTN